MRIFPLVLHALRAACNRACAIEGAAGQTGQKIVETGGQDRDKAKEASWIATEKVKEGSAWER